MPLPAPRGILFSRYLRGVGLIARIQDSNVHYYLHNVHGDVVQLVDQNGTKLRTYRYDAFGNERDANENDVNPFRYCGEYWDKETETLYLRNRNYDPRIGRFGAMDPVQDGINWYTYCGGNPVGFIDPLGLIPTALEASYMAKNIYDATEDDYNVELYGGWILTDIMTNKEGLKIGVYSKTVDGVTEYTLANKGTSQLIDWMNNFMQPLGESSDMKDSISKSMEFVNDHAGYEITMVGHSKGGAEAAANAVASNTNSIIFNPATTFLESYKLSSDTYTASMTVFIVEGEILHTAEGWFSCPIDKLVYLPAQHKTSSGWKVKDSLANHSMDSIIWGLKTLEDESWYHKKARSHS